jgi:hypothetical protein
MDCLVCKKSVMIVLELDEVEVDYRCDCERVFVYKKFLA